MREKRETTDRAVVVGGGTIDPDWAPGIFSEKDFVVAADGGLVFLEQADIVPDLIVGDLDSAPEGFVREYLKQHPRVPLQRLQPQKDDTDMEIAALAAADAGYLQIDLIGATGSRLDHVLGNLQLLALLKKRGVHGRILDPNNRITLHDKPFSVRRCGQWGRYVSFFPLGAAVEELTLTGFVYPLENFSLTGIGTRTVSNQIQDEEAHVSFASGLLVMVESSD